MECYNLSETHLGLGDGNKFKVYGWSLKTYLKAKFDSEDMGDCISLNTFCFAKM